MKENLIETLNIKISSLENEKKSIQEALKTELDVRRIKSGEQEISQINEELSQLNADIKKVKESPSDKSKELEEIEEKYSNKYLKRIRQLVESPISEFSMNLHDLNIKISGGYIEINGKEYKYEYYKSAVKEKITELFNKKYFNGKTFWSDDDIKNYDNLMMLIDYELADGNVIYVIIKECQDETIVNENAEYEKVANQIRYLTNQYLDEYYRLCSDTSAKSRYLHIQYDLKKKINALTIEKKEIEKIAYNARRYAKINTHILMRIQWIFKKKSKVKRLYSGKSINEDTYLEDDSETIRKELSKTGTYPQSDFDYGYSSFDITDK